MSMTESYPQLTDQLDAVRQRWRLKRVTEGMLLAVAVTMAVLIATVAADNLLKLGAVGRTVLAALFWASLIGAAIALVVRRLVEDRRDDFFAALVERQHPELGNQLINALQLGRSNGYGSRRLVEAI